MRPRGESTARIAACAVSGPGPTTRSAIWCTPRGAAWAFHYDVVGDEDDDEAGFKFDSHRFAVGEYVSIREHDGETRTFIVESVRPVPDR